MSHSRDNTLAWRLLTGQTATHARTQPELQLATQIPLSQAGRQRIGKDSAKRTKVEQRVRAATDPSRSARNHPRTAQGVWRIRKGVPGVGRQPMSTKAATRIAPTFW